MTTRHKESRVPPTMPIKTPTKRQRRGGNVGDTTEEGSRRLDVLMTTEEEPFGDAVLVDAMGVPTKELQAVKKEIRMSNKKGLSSMKPHDITTDQWVRILQAAKSSFPTTTKELTVKEKQEMSKAVNAMIQVETRLFPLVTKRVGGKNVTYTPSLACSAFSQYLNKLFKSNPVEISELYSTSGLGGGRDNPTAKRMELEICLWNINKGNSDIGKALNKSRRDLGQNITTDFFYPEKGNKNHKKGDEENNVGENGGVASRPQGSEAPSHPSTSKQTSFAELTRQIRGNYESISEFVRAISKTMAAVSEHMAKQNENMAKQTENMAKQTEIIAKQSILLDRLLSKSSK